MANIPKVLKEKLGLMLGKGHAFFGPVEQRKPYRDDDEGGSGGAELVFESHPLLEQQPVGASSDLTAIATENSETLDAAIERAEEASPELRKQPVLQQALTHGKQMVITPMLTKR